MDPNLIPTPTIEAEDETMRAFDPFFEMREARDHANQWHIAPIWSDETAAAKFTDVESR